MLVKYPVLQKILSLWMLVVFLFAVTPHQFIHDAINHHHDTVDVYHHDTEVSMHHTHCKFLQVVHAPFTPASSAIHNEIPFKYYVFSHNAFLFYPPDRLFYFQHRGPPAACQIL